MKFTFSVKIVEHIYEDEHKPIETHTGEVEAENFNAAKSLAWVHIVNRGDEIRKQTGVMVAYQQFQCRPGSLARISPQDYREEALRTLYPDLTTDERLGLCVLGLSGEVGEVMDLLKKFLYHRNGKPLDIEKLKDELGDVLWYFFVLLDTVGLPFERVAPTRVTRIEQGSLLSSDLINKESLEFCGLKLVSRMGVVADLLSSVLYQNVPLAIDRLRDAMGDVLPYFFVLLNTVGLTLEDAMEANVAKCRARHPNGFNPRYASDSHASEEETHHA